MTHEHTWVRCHACPRPSGPCACAGGVCCDAELTDLISAEVEVSAALADDQLIDALSTGRLGEDNERVFQLLAQWRRELLAGLSSSWRSSAATRERGS